MEKANLVLFQKDDEHYKLLLDWLKYQPHEIIASAHTLNDSYHVLSLIRRHELPTPDAIVLDGDLSDMSYMCGDAKKIEERKQVYRIGSTLIGYSKLYLGENGLNIRPILDIGKNPRSLIRVINQEL